MTRRSYEQACTMARTLDIIGERWTLLVLRELMLGPRRFTELLDGVPGMGRNLLAARLRHLEDEGLLERRPGDGKTQVYALTEDGAALGPAMAALGRWGAERLSKPPKRFLFRPAWAVFPLSYMANREAARGVNEVYEFRIEDDRFHLVVEDGTVEPRNGPAEHADLTITMDAQTMRELFMEDLPPADAIIAGRIAIDGPPEVLMRAMAILAGDPEEAAGQP